MSDGIVPNTEPLAEKLVSSGHYNHLVELCFSVSEPSSDSTSVFEKNTVVAVFVRPCLEGELANGEP